MERLPFPLSQMAILLRNRRSTETEAAAPPSRKEASPKRQESLRETVESIVFAFVLAFLFRTFEAEAFVIPTGSMAPTLYGRHKEGTCKECGIDFVIGASDEVHHEQGYLLAGTRVEGAICPNCRYPFNEVKESLAFNGDRILVNKFPYEFGEPDRWDVFVFKFPEEPKTNYIKRLVGLPNETIRIRNGDVYLWDAERGEQILRKQDPNKQREIQIAVYDDDFPPQALLESGWPERWASVVPDAGDDVPLWLPDETGWSHDAASRTFQLTGPAAADGRLHWIRYRHLVPSPGEWKSALAGAPPVARSQLIDDFCGYNAYYGSSRERRMSQSADQAVAESGGLWVGDLTANLELRVSKIEPNATVQIELCEGIYWYRCRIDLQTGKATLWEVNVEMDAEQERELATAATSVKGTGTWELSFANVDDRLCLWVDDDLIDFGEGASFPRFDVGTPRALESDLSPVGIAAQNCEAEIAHLRIDRDIYYRMAFEENEHVRNNRLDGKVFELQRLLHDPAAWSAAYAADGEFMNQQDYVLGPDRFLALGDNSPRSRDSRFWTSGAGVPREYLVGKAFWIYWPHGVPFLKDGKGYTLTYHKTPVLDQQNGRLQPDRTYPKFTVPFYPQVWRMTRIR
ncbi:MAG: signal peptidase I [Planctomycetaceae bacterium]|nr:signal peptidase I [Planctomycetaceae bacterium]